MSLIIPNVCSFNYFPGEARPKSSQVKERVKSFFSRKSTEKSDDSPGKEDYVNDRQAKRRLGSDRGASSGMMWNESVEPVSQSVKDTTRKIVRTFSRENDGKPAATPTVVVEESRGDFPGESNVPPVSGARDRRLAMATRMEAHSRPVDIEERDKVTKDSKSDVRDRRSRTGSEQSLTVRPSNMPSQLSPAKNDTQNNHRKSPQDVGSLSPTHLTVIGQEEEVFSSPDKKGKRAVSFLEDVSLAERRATTAERRDSLYMDYGDDEAFCIDGWNDDEDSLDDFSDEDPQGSDAEDEVDGPSSTILSGTVNEVGIYRIVSQCPCNSIGYRDNE